MSKELVISATPHETRVAIVEDGLLCEIYIEREKEFALVGSIYKGRVTRVLPGMQSAFVDIGLDSDAFLYVSDFLENLEDYDHIVTTVEDKVQKMEQQGGQVFASSAGGASSALEPPEVVPAAVPEGIAPVPPGSADAPPPVQPTNPPLAAPSYERRDRESGGHGFDREGRGGRGRWGRGGGRGRDKRQGRDLPPSKYASSRPYEPRSYEPRPYQPPPAGYEPVILPGESRGENITEPPSLAASEPASEPPVGDAPPPALPESSFYQPESIAAEPPFDRPAHEEPSPAAESAPENSLSEEEATALAEQLAEAKQEEAQAEAEEGDLGEEEDVAVGEAHDEPLEAGERHDEPAPIEAGEEESEREPVEAAPPAQQEGRPYTARVEEPSRARFQRPMRRGGRQRGGRFPRQQDRQAAPRRPQLISEMLRASQEIIVQIAKEPLGKKGARITSHVALPGRYLVYMPTVDHIGVSRKIGSAEERSRLRRLVAESKGTFPGGFIVRTAAEGASDYEIRSDVEFLGRTWDEIRGRSEQRKAPALLHRDLNLVERILRDYLSHDYTSIWIDNEEEFNKVVEFVSRFQPKLVSRVKLYTKEAPIFEEFGIQQELDKALRPKVWLKSGGYIVINHTEALVAIDVNTGKYVGRGSTRLEDTIVKTNLEAVKEIVRQIRLRDLGGIIVLDLVDMEERRNRDKVMAALDQALNQDRAPSKALSFNEFGLVAITRNRTKQALERVLCQPCPYCTGSGMVKSVPTICYEIQAEARKMALADQESPNLTLRVHPEIAKALKTRESMLIDELEQTTHKHVIIQSDATLHWEQYDIC